MPLKKSNPIYGACLVTLLIRDPRQDKSKITRRVKVRLIYLTQSKMRPDQTRQDQTGKKTRQGKEATRQPILSLCCLL